MTEYKKIRMLMQCIGFLLLFPVLLSAGERDFKIVGYLPEYRMAIIDTSIGKYVSDLIYFNLRVDSSGGLDWTVISEAGIAKVMSMKERYQIRAPAMTEHFLWAILIPFIRMMHRKIKFLTCIPWSR